MKIFQEIYHGASIGDVLNVSKGLAGLNKSWDHLKVRLQTFFLVIFKIKKAGRENQYSGEKEPHLYPISVYQSLSINNKGLMKTLPRVTKSHSRKELV